MNALTPRFHVPKMFAAVACVFVSSMALGQLPPEVELDRLLVRADREIGKGEFTSAIGALEQVLELQTEHHLEVPTAFWFMYAQAAFRSGLYAQAVETATRYLIEAGRDAEHYSDALGLLDEAEEALRIETARQEAERQRQEAAANIERREQTVYNVLRQRLAAERENIEGAFADPLASGGQSPEMVLIPAGSFEMGCKNRRDPRPGKRSPPTRWARRRWS